MKRIWSDNAFCLLCDFAFCVWREKLGAYRSINNIDEILLAFCKVIAVNQTVDNPSDE